MKRTIKVFIASPSDLAEERQKFRDAINVLNDGFGDGANVKYEALGWEDTLASTGRRSQGVINADIDCCDVFILAMHRRWGQKAPDAKPYSSYTEEEYYRAYQRWEKSGKPEIFVFFKRVDAASEADPGPQLRKVISFRKRLEKTKKVLYRYFDSPQSFFEEVDRHFREYAKNELPKANERQDNVELPKVAIQEVERAKQIALLKTEEARKAKELAEAARLQLDAIQLQIAQDAAKLANEGKIEFAREKFTKLVTETTSLEILSLGYEFFERTGDLDSAVKVLEKWLSLTGVDNKSSETADALRKLGNVYETRGELEKTEEIYLKSLFIYDSIGHEEGKARDYCNLGNIYQTRGGLGQAEEMYRKSLAIYESLCNKEGIAIIYGNLGIVYFNRGDLDRSEEMHLQALNINEEIGRKEGMASAFGNLGNIFQNRGDFDEAERMYHRSLFIEELRGHKEGMASDYGNLGNLYFAQKNLERAEEMYQKSLVIEETLGHKEGMAYDYQNLGILYEARGDIEQAEGMYEKSIVLFRALGSPKEREITKWLQGLRNGNSPSESDAEA